MILLALITLSRKVEDLTATIRHLHLIKMLQAKVRHLRRNLAVATKNKTDIRYELYVITSFMFITIGFV